MPALEKNDTVRSRDSYADPLGALHVPTPARGYYGRAKRWCQASPDVRVALSRDRARHFLQIARMGDPWGRHLDELGAGYRMLRWVATASGEKFIAERERRYRALVKLLEEHGAERDVGRRFDLLRASMPKVGRARVRAEREAAGG
jgi:hypothetical protein